MKILWKRGEIAPQEQFLLISTIFCNLILDFCVKRETGFSHRDKRLFEITEVEITSVDCIFFFFFFLLAFETKTFTLSVQSFYQFYSISTCLQSYNYIDSRSVRITVYTDPVIALFNLRGWPDISTTISGLLIWQLKHKCNTTWSNTRRKLGPAKFYLLCKITRTFDQISRNLNWVTQNFDLVSLNFDFDVKIVIYYVEICQNFDIICRHFEILSRNYDKFYDTRSKLWDVKSIFRVIWHNK